MLRVNYVGKIRHHRKSNPWYIKFILVAETRVDTLEYQPPEENSEVPEEVPSPVQEDMGIEGQMEQIEDVVIEVCDKLEDSCISKRLCVSSTRCKPRGGSTTIAACLNCTSEDIMHSTT